MSGYEVSQPILNSPFEEPQEHWRIVEGELPRQQPGRRPAMYFYRPPSVSGDFDPGEPVGTAIELKLVNRIRVRLKEWQKQHWPGITRTTLELLNYWRREGRQHRLFFAQLEAVETIVFLTEARADFLQGIDISLDEPSNERKVEGYRAFQRYACKMATGSGKTTVMGMLAAWSILNKVNNHSDARFSDVVLVVCPNVTIRNRLQELNPANGEASLYRTRDLVPGHLMVDLTKGRVLVTNWHVFEPQGIQTGGVSAKVSKAGVPVRVRETITIGTKTTTARGKRYLTPAELDRQIAASLLTVLDEERDKQGNLKKVFVESVKYIESDTALVNRVLGREVGGKQNILVFNDEAHHAYRIRKPESEESEEDLFGEEEDTEWFFKEATVWVDGLDRIHKLRGINFCVDLSATPYFLGRVGQETNRTFPWVVSDFGLTDAIESGLVKIPQLAVRDTSGAEIPGYFNIWRWILPQLTPAERGGKKGSPKPEAILKWANTPIAMLAGLWEDLRREWEQARSDPRPPVFILVCKNTKIAKVVYEWLAENKPPTGIPPANIEGFLNQNGRVNTIRVDSKVVHETDTDQAKSDESAWMRLTLDTVGKTDWPQDRQGRPIYPEGFEELAKKLGRPLHPPGRDVRCIVSVGMLTEGWDCLDRETEILTPAGWIGMGQVAPGDWVYSLNRETDKLEVVPVLEYGERPVRPNERMVRFQSQHFDIRVTEGHVFYLKYRNPRASGKLSGQMIARTGAQLAERRSAYALPLAAETADPFPELPLTDDEIRFIAWFMTDGGFSDYDLVIAQSKCFKDEIRALLQRLGLDYAERIVERREGTYANPKPLHTFRIPKGTHSGSLKRNGWSRYSLYLDKAVAPALHAMTRHQFLVFWQELLKGDGERRDSQISGWLWCGDKAQADAYTHLAVVRGLAASCHAEITSSGKTVYRVSVREKQWMTSDPVDSRASRIALEAATPGEIVWCVRNQNSTLVTRRNGKIAILGNCNTVTHIVGLRPFMSQLLCEQVVGRGLRRSSYEVGEDGKLTEEVAKIFGVPLEVIPFKENRNGPKPPPVKRHHVCAVPEKARFEITYPRVEGYRQAIRNRVTVDWDAVAPLRLDPTKIPPEVEMTAGIVNNRGRPSLTGPGKLERVDLNPYRSGRRFQELVFELARDLTRDYVLQPGCEAPAHVLFPQLVKIAERYLKEKVQPIPPADILDVFLSPYYGWVIERLVEAIKPDASLGEAPEVPRYETSRGPGSTADVDFWTSRDVREIVHGHLNYIVADTKQWEQSAAYVIDTHEMVDAFVKNSGLGFAIPYLHNGQPHDYVPDFLIRLKGEPPRHLILETKGFDPLTEVKMQAARRWVNAVNADGSYGRWHYAVARRPEEVRKCIEETMATGQEAKQGK